jgi:site-specific DNA-adenine methylase
MAEITKKDIFDTLVEFYGKVIEPRFDRIEKKLDEHDQNFRDIFNHFDQIYQRFERLETEYYSIVAAIDGMEKRLN